MAILPKPLYTAEQTRLLDGHAQSLFGVSEYTLMQRAALALLRLLQEKHPGKQRLLVVCGSGNNAGDGYSLATQATAEGYTVTVVALMDDSTLSEAAKQAHTDWLSSGGTVNQEVDLIDGSYDIIVDAILGTGLNRPLENDMLNAVNKINANGAIVISADMPTGVLADTGQVVQSAVYSHATMSFLGLNQGLFTGDAVDYTGEVYFNDLGLSGLDDDVADSIKPNGRLIQADDIKPLLTPRKPSTHKGQCGHVLIIGGGEGMSGAALLAGQAALRAGAGLVTVATHPSHAKTLTVVQPELMVQGVRDKQDIDFLIDAADVIAVGAGLGQSEWSSMLYDAAVRASKPVVVDADALNLLSDEHISRDNWILTPHPAEAARLTGETTQEVQASRFLVAKSIAEHYNAVTVLKGAGSIVVTPGVDDFSLLQKGNAGMASGGMGDALTGIIAAMVAQGLSLHNAAKAGAYVHADAADRVAKARGMRGMVASDVIEALYKSVNP